MANERKIWETPFTYAPFPSVNLIVESDGEETALLIVAPGGLDTYPKYLVKFTEVFAFTCEEEAGATLDLGQSTVPKDTFAYVWAESPHVGNYLKTIFGTDKYLEHYVVIGGDNIISIVCAAPPSIEEITARRELSVTYMI
jgi:hypothetical protein